jgi:hypothetical protein
MRVTRTSVVTTSVRKRALAAALWYLAAGCTASASLLVTGQSQDIAPFFGLAVAAFVFADPFRAIWSRRRVTLADLPRASETTSGEEAAGVLESRPV